MTIGSGLFSQMKARLTHLVKPAGGFQGEFFNIRKDIAATLGSLAAFAVEEFTNAAGTAAPGAAALLDAAATVAAPVTVLAAAMKAPGLAQLVVWPRALSFTTAGTTPADAPATATITGLDQNGAAQTEVVTLAQTGTIAHGVKYWSNITSVVYPAADGTGATVSIGIDAAAIKAATATVVTAVTLSASDLVQTGLATNPRALVFTTGGTTPAHAPASCLITGKDINGLPISETLLLAQTATTAISVNSYARVTSIAYAPGDGTGATIAITFAAPIGLRKTIKSRAGYLGLLKEIAGGSVVTNGALVDAATAKPYGTYAPNTPADGTTDYAIYYGYDATKDLDAVS